MNIRDGLGRLALPMTLFLLLVVGFQASAETRPDPMDGLWETWSAESYTLEPRESFQFPVAYEDIPARRWRLVVNGGDANCDLSVLRMTDESLVYFETNETLHEVSIPWGKGEEQKIAFKCSDLSFAILIDQDNIMPAPYLARAKWVQLTAPEAMSDTDIETYISEAYAIICKKLTKAKRKELAL